MGADQPETVAAILAAHREGKDVACADDRAQLSADPRP